jgi:hypothetical protein
MQRIGSLGIISRLLSSPPLQGLLALIGILITVSLALFVRVPRPQLLVEILRETDVLDVHQSVPDLKIMFRDKDSQEQQLNLRMITFRLSNIGDVDVVQAQYDQQEPWGIKVSSGQVIRVNWVTDNQEYLQKLLPTPIGNTVQFEKIVFDQGKLIIYELLVLHSKQETPTVSTFGKIAGIDQQAYACDSSRSPDDAICRRRHGAEAQDVVAT